MDRIHNVLLFRLNAQIDLLVYSSLYCTEMGITFCRTYDCVSKKQSPMCLEKVFQKTTRTMLSFHVGQVLTIVKI